MFIQTEATPNPNAIKFLPGRTVSETPSDVEPKGAQGSPLAMALYALEGVEGVFFGFDFISVTRSETGPDWRELKPQILAAVMDHFVSGGPLFVGAHADPAASAGAEDVGDSEVVAEIRQLLDTRIRPAVAQDGGDILFEGFNEETGVVSLRLRGACSGCPSASATLKAGVEQMLRHYVPEVTGVEQVL